MRIPTDYTQGYEKARAISPDVADKYVKHTLIGDPLAEESGLHPAWSSLLVLWDDYCERRIIP